jgi:hypothetical protein
MHDVSRDITPLLTSFLSSKGPNVRRAVGVSHPRVVIGDAAHSPRSASFVWDAAELFLVSSPIAEQALVDSRTVACRMPTPFTPLVAFVVLFGAVLPPICKVVEASIKHGLRDI